MKVLTQNTKNPPKKIKSLRKVFYFNNKKLEIPQYTFTMLSGCQHSRANCRIHKKKFLHKISEMMGH